MRRLDVFGRHGWRLGVGEVRSVGWGGVEVVRPGRERRVGV
jgi:hypothetical protein